MTEQKTKTGLEIRHIARCSNKLVCQGRRQHDSQLQCTSSISSLPYLYTPVRFSWSSGLLRGSSVPYLRST